MENAKYSHAEERRTAAIYIFIILLISMVFFKLYSVATSDYNKVLPSLSGQYTRNLSVAERRGFIFDRSGNILAGVEDAFNCIVDPSKIDVPIGTAAEEISRVSSLTKDSAFVKLMSGKPFVIRITEEVNNSYMISYQTYRRNLPGNATATHIIGYLNSDGNGMTGIESAYNDFLKNTSSAKVEAAYNSDAMQKSFKGSPITVINYEYEVKTGVMLTLDGSLQREVEKIADKYLQKGAIVITSVSTGEILASVSRPNYSPDNLQNYIDSSEGEFVNRAFSAFTPGSVFKTVVALAALEEDAVYYDMNYTCTGEIDVAGKIFACHKKSGHGELDMCSAYAYSCNTYFMNLALTIGYDKIYNMAKRFGIGEKLYLDNLKTQYGNISKIENPPPAFVANIAIGQGELLITPLEAVKIFSCIANDGILPQLSLVKAFIFPNSVNNIQSLSTDGNKILSDKTVEYMLYMTKACVDYGTGMTAMPAKGGAGGKTSSAESGQYIDMPVTDKDTGEKTIQKTQIVHSWFAGYYPSPDVDASRRPLYAIAVIAEGGVTSNVKSSVIFKEICDYLGVFLYD